jgi:hypothetical protein
VLLREVLKNGQALTSMGGAFLGGKDEVGNPTDRAARTSRKTATDV